MLFFLFIGFVPFIYLILCQNFLGFIRFVAL